jgi:hypothetical protein
MISTGKISTVVVSLLALSIAGFIKGWLWKDWYRQFRKVHNIVGHEVGMKLSL